MSAIEVQDLTAHATDYQFSVFLDERGDDLAAVTRLLWRCGLPAAGRLAAELELQRRRIDLRRAQTISAMRLNADGDA